MVLHGPVSSPLCKIFFFWLDLVPITRHSEQFYCAICQTVMNCYYLAGELCHTENECGEEQVQISNYLLYYVNCR